MFNIHTVDCHFRFPRMCTMNQVKIKRHVRPFNYNKRAHAQLVHMDITNWWVHGCPHRALHTPSDDEIYIMQTLVHLKNNTGLWLYTVVVFHQTLCDLGFYQTLTDHLS